MISKSKYVEGLNCQKSVWLELNKQEVEKHEDSTLATDYGNAVGAVAKNYFGPHIDIKRTTNKEMAEQTKEALKLKDVVITEASFIYKNLFCSVDILVKQGNKYKIYEVKSKKNPNKEELEKFINDISFQYYVLSNCNLEVTEAYLMNINPDYIKEGELDLTKLFKLTNLTTTVKELFPYVKTKTTELEDYLKISKEPKKEISENCKDCPYFYYCTKDLPKNNIFELNSRLTFSRKISLYQQGIITKSEALKEKLSKNVIQQINYDIKDLPDYIDVAKLTEFLNSLKEPLYFLDFETYSSVIPEYDGDKVNETIPFQYSLHYYDNQELKHTEFLGDGITDPRRKLAEQLVKDINPNVCILAYHKSVECGIIKRLAEKFPDLKEQLLLIANNIKDLEEPFAKRYFYTKELSGRSSIKVVLPALCKDLNYLSLEGVHKGDEATSAYLNLKNLGLEEQAEIRKQLLTYCSLDTYAMVRILEELTNKIHSQESKKILKKKNK